MPRFRLTHRKRTYLNCQRHRVDFKITVKYINFRMNKAFLVNSYYVIFRKENKHKKFQSKNKCLKQEDLKHVAVDEKIKFRACLLQDLQHKYLERYIAKDKRFVLRQVTEVPGEVLYVDCGYFTVPLHVFGMLPSGQALTVELKDPNGMASGTVELWIEHEPRVLVANYLPDVWKTLRDLIYPDKARTPLPPNVLATNRDKLDFLKKMKLDHHHGRYDLSDDDESEQADDDTHSESDLGDDPGQFGSFTFGSSAGQEGKSGKSGKSMPATDGSALPRTESLLDATMFQLDELAPSPVPADHMAENTSGKDKQEEDRHQQNAGSTVPGATETPRSQGEDGESVSTITVSAKDHASPRHPPHHLPSARATSFSVVLPELPEVDTAGEESGAESRSLSMGRNHVPFHSDAKAVPAVVAGSAAAEEDDAEVWEQPPEEWLVTPATPAGPPRLLPRAQSGNGGMGQAGAPAPAKPTLNPPLRPPAAVTTGTIVGQGHGHEQGHVLHRASSAPGGQLSARALLSMASEDDRDGGLPDSARSGYSSGPGPMRHQGPVPRLQPAAAAPVPVVRPPVPTLATGAIAAAGPAGPVRVTGPMSATPSPTLGKKTIKVPVRLGSNDDLSAALAAEVRVGYLSPSAADARKELLQQNINVRDLRRNFERPPLHKDNSGSTGSQTSRSSEDGNNGNLHTPRQPTALDGPVPRPSLVSRANSERSCSTLSTHDTLPARPAVVPVLPLGSAAAPYNGKILVPVRLQSAQQEQQVAGAGGIGYSPRESPGLPRHQLHRSATAPHLVSPVRLAAPSASAEYRAPHRAEYNQPPVQAGHRRVPSGPTPPPAPPLPPISGEKADVSRTTKYDHSTRYSEHSHHPHLHRTATAPSLGQSAQEYARSLQTAAYGGSPASTAYRHPSPAADPYLQDFHAPNDCRHPEPSHHSSGHVQRSVPSHIMAPPIRLRSDDLVPEQYERYTHMPRETHHRHHHTEATEVHRGEFLRGMAYGSQRRDTRDVYA